MISINGTQKLKVRLEAPVTTNQLTIVSSFTEFSSPRNSTEEISDSIVCQTKNLESVTVLASNAIASRIRKLKYLSIKNSDTHASTVVLDYYANTSPIGLWSCTLNPGDTIYYDEGEGWRTIDSTGAIKQSLVTNEINDLTQIVNSFVAGEDLGGQRVVMIVAGEAFYYDPTDENNVGRDVGVTKSAALTGDLVEVVSKGVMTGFSGSITQDDIYYVGAAGTLTSIIPVGPGIDMRVGVAIDGNTLNVNFSEPCVLI